MCLLCRVRGSTPATLRDVVEDLPEHLNDPCKALPERGHKRTRQWLRYQEPDPPAAGARSAPGNATALVEGVPSAAPDPGPWTVGGVPRLVLRPLRTYARTTKNFLA